MVCTSAVWAVSATIAASELILGAGRRIEPRRIEAGGGGPLGVEPRRIAALKLALARCRAAHLSNRGAGGCAFDCILRLLRLRSRCRVGDTEGFHSKITDAPAGKSFQRLDPLIGVQLLARFSSWYLSAIAVYFAALWSPDNVAAVRPDKITAARWPTSRWHWRLKRRPALAPPR